MASLATARSFLFAPGSDERKLRRALESGADAVIADLEDAVLPEAKDEARAVTAELLADGRSDGARLVRVNAVGSAWLDADLDWLAGLPVDGVVLPKADPEGAALLAATGLRVIAIVETARGLRQAYETAVTPGVEALMLGAVDLGLELGLEPRPDAQELLLARSSLVVDSAAARIRAPIDRVWVETRDLDGLAADCALARSLGLRGKACVHPDQIAVVETAFAPSAGELGRARAIVEAFERAQAEGRGAVALDGEMIDLPVVERARRLLADEKRSLLDVD